MQVAQCAVNGRAGHQAALVVLRQMQAAGGGRLWHLCTREVQADCVLNVPSLAGRPGVGGSGNHGVGNGGLELALDLTTGPMEPRTMLGVPCCE